MKDISANVELDVLIGKLAEEYGERLSNGEKPDIEEYRPPVSGGRPPGRFSCHPLIKGMLFLFCPDWQRRLGTAFHRFVVNAEKRPNSIPSRKRRRGWLSSVHAVASGVWYRHNPKTIEFTLSLARGPRRSLWGGGVVKDW